MNMKYFCLQSKYLVKVFIVSFVLLFLPLKIGAKKNDGEQKLINLGYISYFPDFELTKDRKHIIFKIRNNTNLTISNIYGWIYQYKEGEPRSSLLVNNPNQGGILIEGGPHQGGKTVSWKFKLLPLRKPATPKDRYSLRTSNKSIFYYKHPLITSPSNNE